MMERDFNLEEHMELIIFAILLFVTIVAFVFYAAFNAAYKIRSLFSSRETKKANLTYTIYRK